MSRIYRISQHLGVKSVKGKEVGISIPMKDLIIVAILIFLTDLRQFTCRLMGHRNMLIFIRGYNIFLITFLVALHHFNVVQFCVVVVAAYYLLSFLTSGCSTFVKSSNYFFLSLVFHSSFKQCLGSSYLVGRVVSIRL